MKRVFWWSLWLFLLPAILLLRGLQMFTFWLIRQVPEGPAGFAQKWLQGP